MSNADDRPAAKPGRVKQLIALAIVLTMAVLGGYQVIAGIRGLTATTVTCSGVVMSPGDSCSTLRLKRSRYEAWSRAGAPPAPLALPPNLQPRDRIMVRDIDGMRALQHDDAGGQIAVGIWLLLPGLLIAGAIGVATLIIRARKLWSHPGESNP